MQEKRVRPVIGLLLIVIFALAATIIALVTQPTTAAPTPDIESIRTQAIQEFLASMTAATPPEPTITPSPPFPASSPTVAASALPGTPNCLGLRFIRDVTIPDNTEMEPAEVFTKSWMVENSGTCPWKPGFQVVLIGGLAMGGSPFRVAQTVGPDGSIQISIKMVAPTNQIGVVQGTWKMSDLDGVQFGDFLSVVVVVKGPGGSPQSDSTPTPP